VDIRTTKNQFAGQRVFIIGNGPSIRDTNLALLKSDYSIAMNRISHSYELYDWQPTHFVCSTSNIDDPAWRADILASVGMGIPVLAWDKLRHYFAGYENVAFCHCSHGPEICETAPLEWWSDDVAARVCKFGTSMLVAFQWAVYMGFSEVYIVGADLGFQSSLVQKIFYKLGLQALGHRFDKNHFTSSYGTPGAPAADLNRNMLAAHHLFRDVAKARGVSVYNATVGGELEVYPRVAFDALF
jgi:hypothetical protein